MNKDIFISYRNDGEGNNFAARLFDALDVKEYSVYFNSKEQHSGSFPDRLKEAIEKCSDFILIVSYDCLAGLKETRESDWVRAEILHAHKLGKSIIPVYIGKTVVPDQWEDYPEDIRFLFALQSVYLPEQFDSAPITDLISKFVSKPAKEIYRDVANSNEKYDLHKDFMETLARAESGDAEAMFEIGCMYYHGFATSNGSDGKTNYAEALRWFNKAIEQKSEISQYIQALVGNLYYWGQVPYEEQSFAKAMSYYEQAAESPLCWDVKNRIGFMKSEGFGRKYTFDEIVDHYNNSNYNGVYSAKVQLALYYLRYGKFKQATELLESIEDPDANVEHKLGIIYRQGLHKDPPEPDMYRAVEHLRNAADLGHSESLHVLGLIYFRGENGFRQNFKKAREYQKLAAEAGHWAANYDYAWMCKYGIGGERNIDAAIHHFELSASQGDILSMTELAQLYQEPECKNYQKAFDWAKKSVTVDNPQGEFILGNMYFFGRGCEADMDRAMRYYRKAFDHGVYQAKFMMERINAI